MVLERLREDPFVRCGAGFVEAHTDLVGCIDRLSVRPWVILLDCVSRSGFEPGRVVAFSEAALRGWPRGSSDCHHLAPLETIDLLRTLHPGAATRIDLVALCIDRLAWSPRWATPEAAATAVAMVKRLLGPGRRETAKVAEFMTTYRSGKAGDGPSRWHGGSRQARAGATAVSRPSPGRARHGGGSS
jgi:hypothetical protein